MDKDGLFLFLVLNSVLSKIAVVAPLLSSSPETSIGSGSAALQFTLLALGAAALLAYALVELYVCMVIVIVLHPLNAYPDHHYAWTHLLIILAAGMFIAPLNWYLGLRFFPKMLLTSNDLVLATLFVGMHSVSLVLAIIQCEGVIRVTRCVWRIFCVNEVSRGSDTRGNLGRK